MEKMISYTVDVFSDGTKNWYLDGKLHNEHGPAIEWTDGTKLFFLNGKLLTQEEFENQKENNDD